VPCRICGGEQYEAEPHETSEHSEDWVNLADARQSGEVIWMDTFVLDQALSAAIPENSSTELRTKAHVDRRIVQALVDTIKETDPEGDPSVGIFEDSDALWGLHQLQSYLDSNPKKEIQ
jgi:hypothetical protein